MIAALILGTYAVAVALVAPVLLDRFWPADRTPRLTVALLQILSCSFLAASVGAGLALALTLVEGLSELSPALDRCADALPLGEHSSVATWLGHVGLVGAGALVLRILYCVLMTFGRARFRRRAHLKVLRMLATRDEHLGVLVLDHPAPACYCLPGDIVITTGALSRLSAPQLEAVLLHERAHVSGHHHLVIAMASAIGRTVPHVRLLTYAERETRRLVELIADDAAVAHTGAPTVAAALAVIGTSHSPELDPTPAPALPPALTSPGGPAPDSALGMDSSPTLRRIRRLLRLDQTLTGRARALSLTVAVFAIALPITLLGVSGASLISHCPPDTDEHDARHPGQAVTTVVDAEPGTAQASGR
ncbi:M56 family metallopeptidase [Catenulispora subtropica]|uniref:M56 family metallopeptidase n=1 Tax=Catenulispora subtropica TaxID=450798 RepID=A0ABP5CZY5_9ACTN